MRRIVLHIMFGFLLMHAFNAMAESTFVIESSDGVPLIQMSDIVSYEWANHTITLKPGFRETLEKKIGVTIKAFVVKVEGQTIYRGNFVSPLISVSVNSTVIRLNPVLDKDLSKDQVRIVLGYPTENFFTDQDLRNDMRILRALERASILKRGT